MFDLTISDKFCFLLINSEGLASPYMRTEDILKLGEHLDQINNTANLSGLILYNKPNTNFCLGVDPTELIKLKSKDSIASWLNIYYQVFEKLSQLKIPKIAVIQGKCYSFGLELILACDYRIGTEVKKASFAFENLSQGITSVFFGSKRISSLTGLSNALDLTLSERKFSATSAANKGILDELCPSSFLFERAKEYATGNNKPTRTTKWGVELTPLGRKLIYNRARTLIEEKTQGFYPAYFNVLKLLYLCYEEKNETVRGLEEKFFISTLLTQQSQNVLHLFQAKKEILTPQANQTYFAQNISFSVHGSHAIFSQFLEKGVLAGLHFYYYAKQEDSIPSVLKKLYKRLTKKVSRKELTNMEVQSSLARVIPRLGFPKNLTSSFLLSFDDILETDTEKYLRTYYFNFHRSYPLIEICTKQDLANKDRTTLHFLAYKIKTPLLFSNNSSFSFHILCHYLLEVFYLHYEGNSIQHINTALVEFGFFLSPFEIIERIGFSSFLSWLDKNQEQENAKEIRHHIDSILKGVKKTQLQPLSEEPTLAQKILSYQNEKGHTSGTKPYPQDRISDRCVLRIINETASLIEQGVFTSPYAADYAVVASCGFPDFWGGPLRYCETIGLEHQIVLFHSYEKEYGKRFTPSSFLVERQSKEKPFFEF